MRTWHVSDVMTADVIAVGPDATYRELVDLLAARSINAVPVVDDDRRVLGVVSESDLLRKIEYVGADEPHWFERRRRAQLRKAAGRTATGLMTAPAVVALTSTSVRSAARRMDAAGVKQLSVEDGLGRLVGIVTRGDLLKEHLRTDQQIAADVRAAVHAIVLAENVSAVSTRVERGVVTLAGRVERWSTATLAVRSARLVPGVVEVRDRLTFDYDDHRLADPVPAGFVA
ncbi:CBS domain-containing protein [Actinoplanes sp. NPDC024001]|uniref:CBS domain-containing protein n=1 Tax=Actinoplanes sp. NPDC024001 TaxID=3154598 RepID=UPI0033F2B20B